MSAKLKRYVIEYILAAILSCLAASLLFTPAWINGSLIYAGDLGGSDLLDMNLPLRHLAAKSVKDGSLPLWRPEIGCGFPLLAEGQAGVFYPLTLPLFLIFSTVWSSNLSIILTLAAAAWGGYVLGRVHGLSKPASAFTGCTVAFSPILVFRLKHINMIQVAAWLPLSLAAIKVMVSSAIELTSTQNGPAGADKSAHLTSPSQHSTVVCPPTLRLKLSSLTLALCWLVQILAGHPHAAYICGLACLIYATVLLLSPLITGKSRVRLLKYICLVLSGCALMSLLMGACQLLPTWELVGQSVRSTPCSWQNLQSFPFALRHFKLFLNPFCYENPATGMGVAPNQDEIITNGMFWESMPYLGLLPLLLWPCTLGAWRLSSDENSTKRTLIAELAIVSLIFLLLALGTWGKIYWVLWKFCPGFNLFRFPARFLIPFGVSASLLAGLGADNLLDTFFSNRSKVGKAITGYLLTVLAFGNFYWSTNSYVAYLPSDIFMDSPTTKLIEDNSRVASPKLGNYWNVIVRLSGGWKNVGYVEDMFHTLMPDSNVFWGIRQSGKNNALGGALSLKYYAEVLLKLTQSQNFKTLTPNGPPSIELTDEAMSLYRMHNVNYLLNFGSAVNKDLKPLPLMGTAYLKNLRTELHAYKLNIPRPRIYMLPKFKIAEPQAEISSFLKTYSKDIDKSDTCIFYDDQYEQSNFASDYEIGPKPSSGDSQPEQLKVDEYCKIIYNTPLIIDAELNTATFRALLFPENIYPAWRAYIDGKPLKIYRANYAFMGCVIPPGKHYVRFEFYSRSLWTGLSISCVAMLAFLVLTVFTVLQMRQTCATCKA